VHVRGEYTFPKDENYGLLSYWGTSVGDECHIHSIDDLHEWYAFGLQLHWRVCAGVESGVGIRRVGPYPTEK